MHLIELRSASAPIVMQHWDKACRQRMFSTVITDFYEYFLFEMLGKYGPRYVSGRLALALACSTRSKWTLQSITCILWRKHILSPLAITGWLDCNCKQCWSRFCCERVQDCSRTLKTTFGLPKYEWVDMCINETHTRPWRVFQNQIIFFVDTLIQQIYFFYYGN